MGRAVRRRCCLSRRRTLGLAAVAAAAAAAAAVPVLGSVREVLTGQSQQFCKTGKDVWCVGDLRVE